MTVEIIEHGFREVDDEIAAAQMLQINEMEKLIAKNRKSMEPEKHEDFDGENCVECGEALPQLRLEMGKVRCVSCQSIIEARRKQYGS